MDEKPSFYALALGANLPFDTRPPQWTLRQSLVAIGKRVGAIRAISRFYRTPAFPKGAGPDYVNAAAVILSDAEPQTVLDQLHAIEAEFGRERVQRWGQRSLDLDLLACDGRVYPDLATFETWRDLDLDTQTQTAPECLVLPHPRLQDRPFVLVPLADILPGWAHPVSGKTVCEMLHALPAADRAEVTPI